MSTFLQATNARAWRIAGRIGEALLVGAIVYSLIQGNWSEAAMLGLFLATSLSNAAGYAFSWYKRLGFESSTDQMFGTAIAPNEADTASDLIADLLGALGAALLANWGLPERTKRHDCASPA